MIFFAMLPLVTLELRLYDGAMPLRHAAPPSPIALFRADVCRFFISCHTLDAAATMLRHTLRYLR